MDGMGGGGCCIARYGCGNYYDLSRMDRILRRFRPIAPKPAASGSGSGSYTEDKSIPCARKRRYVRNRKRNESSDGSSSASVAKKQKVRKNGGKRKSPSPEENVSGGSCYAEHREAVVTLPLLPETPKREYSLTARGFSSGAERAPLWLSFGSEESGDVGGGGGGGPSRSDGAERKLAQPLRVVGTQVHVECVTETWGEGLEGYGGGMGMDLESDVCPGFVSDGYGIVVWVNRAYREMVVGRLGEEEEVVLVWLVPKEGLRLPPLPDCRMGFTCTVRVVTCGKEKYSRTVPCDVWRLEGGRGFAWRLDIKAALSLSL